jgi:hypothetical protein
MPRHGGDSAGATLRIAVAERDGWTCQRPGCGRPLQNTSPRAPDYMHAGHIRAHADGGRPTLDNLRAECRLCNQTAAVADGIARRAAKRARVEAEAEAKSIAAQRIAATDPAPVPGTPQRISRARTQPNPVAGAGFLDGGEDGRRLCYEVSSSGAPAILPGNSELNKNGDPIPNNGDPIPTISRGRRANKNGGAVNMGSTDPGELDSNRNNRNSSIPIGAKSPALVQMSGAGRHSAPTDFAGVPWMAGLLRVPADATWPRYMSAPHPDAVGSYGQRFERWWRDHPWSRLYPAPRWWQRLVARRVLEHDASGALVWDEWILTLARQLGKSVILQGLALWRMEVGPRLFGEPSEVLHVANKIKISREIQAPARAWARGHQHEGWSVREMAGSEAVTHPNGGRWQCAASGSTYGFTSSLAMVDEAWQIPTDTVDNGISPTLLERASPQLGLISTAHPQATNLVVDRRRAALLGAPVLLIEWSMPPWLDDDDRSGWRLASPVWTPKRERLIAKALVNARAAPVRAGEPDPIKAWRAQYTNQWPDKALTTLGTKGERYLPEGAWAQLESDADPVGDLVVALEDHAGIATAVSVAARTSGDAIVVNGFALANRADAFAFVQSVIGQHTVALVLLGPVLAESGDAGEIGQWVKLEPANAADTKAALALLRQLVTRRMVLHPPAPDLDGQLERCRVVETAAGIRVTSDVERFDVVRAAAWAVAAVERLRTYEPSVW